MVYENADLTAMLTKTGVILPVDAGVTCATASDVPGINPPK
jgi:hypothetical protein